MGIIYTCVNRLSKYFLSRPTHQFQLYPGRSGSKNNCDYRWQLGTNDTVQLYLVKGFNFSPDCRLADWQTVGSGVIRVKVWSRMYNLDLISTISQYHSLLYRAAWSLPWPQCQCADKAQEAGLVFCSLGAVGADVLWSRAGAVVEPGVLIRQLNYRWYFTWALPLGPPATGEREERGVTSHITP